VTARAAGVPVVDANGDRYEAPHEANLFDMNAKYADVMSEQEALDYIASQKLNATAGAVPSKASRLRGTS
jgi:hypothetical protein